MFAHKLYLGGTRCQRSLFFQFLFVDRFSCKQVLWYVLRSVKSFFL